MRTNHRSKSLGAGTPRLALAATTAALAAVAAVVFLLLHPMGSDAAGSGRASRRLRPASDGSLLTRAGAPSTC
jgi:hypothetical protein